MIILMDDIYEQIVFVSLLDLLYLMSHSSLQINHNLTRVNLYRWKNTSKIKKEERVNLYILI